MNLKSQPSPVQSLQSPYQQVDLRYINLEKQAQLFISDSQTFVHSKDKAMNNNNNHPKCSKFLCLFILCASLFLILWLNYAFCKQRIIYKYHKKQMEHSPDYLQIQKIQTKKLRDFLQINQKAKVTALQSIIAQNGTQIILSMLVQNIHRFNETEQFSIFPMYMWLGNKPLPSHYKIRLDQLRSYIFIRDCDVLIQKFQKKFKKKYQTLQRINIRSDLCKIIYMYQYAGLYADLDTIIDLKCLNQYLECKPNHFQQYNLYSIFFRQQGSQQVLKAAQKFDYYHTQEREKPYATAMLHEIYSKQTIKSGCIQHFKDNTYLNKKIS